MEMTRLCLLTAMLSTPWFWWHRKSMLALVRSSASMVARKIFGKSSSANISHSYAQTEGWLCAQTHGRCCKHPSWLPVQEALTGRTLAPCGSSDPSCILDFHAIGSCLGDWPKKSHNDCARRSFLDSSMQIRAYLNVRLLSQSANSLRTNGTSQ